MAEAKSALETVYKPGAIGVAGGSPSVSIRERLERNLVQVAGWQSSFESVCDRLAERLDCRIPTQIGRATSTGDRSVFRVRPERLWIAGSSNDEVLQELNVESIGGDAVISQLGHGRTVLRVSGPESDQLLNRGLPVDLDPEVFPANAFAQSVIHHMHVLVHRVDLAEESGFDVYVSRELAVSFWEWLTEAAAPLGCEIRQPGRSW
ncbi:MAG: hypothetical protein OXJ56_10960 [Rhodospirillaceae bacterium]|nr:hypothetical protein [Rhodospirillaceae bacterium]